MAERHEESTSSTDARRRARLARLTMRDLYAAAAGMLFAVAIGALALTWRRASEAPRPPEHAREEPQRSPHAAAVPGQPIP